MSLNKIIVGSEEWCGLPQLNIPAIKARVDSGAKTSALHAVNIIPFKKDGDPWVRYEVHPLQNDGKTSIHCESPVIDKRKVKSSSGLSELRYVIKSIISIAESTWEIDLTLTNRDSMGYRMLLGRQAMAGKMLVDPEASFQLGKLTPTLIENYYHIHIKKYSGLKIGLL
ncbi:ATP-dependent zinc protease, partial [Flavobacteriaceae bacterium]|nr:ATP-dependent zinc protease [Flavobacteriaceae bacterium]